MPRDDDWPIPAFYDRSCMRVDMRYITCGVRESPLEWRVEYPRDKPRSLPAAAGTPIASPDQAKDSDLRPQSDPPLQEQASKLFVRSKFFSNFSSCSSTCPTWTTIMLLKCVLLWFPLRSDPLWVHSSGYVKRVIEEAG